MISEKFTVNSDEKRMAKARAFAEGFAARMGLDRHDTLRLDLLVEETLGMVRTMVEEFYGQMWLVSEKKRCEIHLEATADMDVGKRQELLSASRTGKNAARRGFMAMLGEMLSNAAHSFGNVLDAYGQETVRYGIVHSDTMAGHMPDGMMPVWTLQSYRDDLSRNRGEDEAEAAWDELEKSVVASLADDVIVGVRGDRIELVIVKDFG